MYIYIYVHTFPDEQYLNIHIIYIHIYIYIYIYTLNTHIEWAIHESHKNNNSAEMGHVLSTIALLANCHICSYLTMLAVQLSLSRPKICQFARTTVTILWTCTLRKLYFHFLSNRMGCGCGTVFLSILNQIEFHLVQNLKENCHHDHIPFDLKGKGNMVFSVKNVPSDVVTS